MEIVIKRLAPKELAALSQTCTHMYTQCKHALKLWLVRQLQLPGFFLLSAQLLSKASHPSSWLAFLKSHIIDIDFVLIESLKYCTDFDLNLMDTLFKCHFSESFCRFVLLSGVSCEDQRLKHTIRRIHHQHPTLEFSVDEYRQIIIWMASHGCFGALLSFCMCNSRALVVLEEQFSFLLHVISPGTYNHDPRALFVQHCMSWAGSETYFKQQAGDIAVHVFYRFHHLDCKGGCALIYQLANAYLLSGTQLLKLLEFSKIPNRKFISYALLKYGRHVIEMLVRCQLHDECLNEAVKLPSIPFNMMRYVASEASFKHWHVEKALRHNNQSAITVFLKRGLKTEIMPTHVSIQVMLSGDWELIYIWTFQWKRFPVIFYDALFQSIVRWSEEPTRPGPKKLIQQLSKNGFDVFWKDHHLLKTMSNSPHLACRELAISILGLSRYADLEYLPFALNAYQNMTPAIRRTKLGKAMLNLSFLSLTKNSNKTQQLTPNTHHKV